MSSQPEFEQLFDRLELTDYESIALEQLLILGRTTAPDLSEATGIPKARIYGVLDELADAGYVNVFPGRPKEFQPRPPAVILETSVENRRQDFESFRGSIEDIREDFLATFEPFYERAAEEVTPTEELFYVVDVGEPSERETRRLYREADDQLCVITKSFEYFETIETAFGNAVDRGLEVRILFLDPGRLSPENRAVQGEILRRLDDEYPSVERKFSPERLPWRGTIADPSLEYESGEAILLVEEENIPLNLRQAAVTENASFVAGIGRYFDMIWKYESAPREL